MPWVAMLVCTPGSAMALRISWFRRATISFGMPAGPTKQYQLFAAKPGTPASAMVGTSGMPAWRASVVTPSTLSLPALTCGSADGGLAKLICTWPAIRSAMDGPPPL